MFKDIRRVTVHMSRLITEALRTTQSVITGRLKGILIRTPARVALKAFVAREVAHTTARLIGV